MTMTRTVELGRDHVGAWRTALPALGLVLAVVFLAYRETVAAMVSVWARSDTFAHGFLVLPIVFWMIWRKRHDLASLRPRPCSWMLVPMAAIASVWLLADLVEVNSVTELSMTALLVLAVPAVLGLEVARVILFPLAFTFFAVPIGEFMLPQLMSWTADFTVLALRATGVPVYREFNQIVIPTGRWAVVEACSGVRYLIASFMVGTLFGYLHYRSTQRRWIFAAVAVAVPIVANWVRAYLIVLLGHVSNNRIAVGVDHLIYGWLFFGVVMAFMYAVGALWSEAAAVPVVAARERLHSPHNAMPPQSGFWLASLFAAAIAVAPLLALRSIGYPEAHGMPRLAALEGLSGGWAAASEEAIDWKPAFRNPSFETNGSYVSGPHRVGVYTGYYRQQSYRQKLVSSDNVLIRSDDPVWLQIASPTPLVFSIEGRDLIVRSTLLRKGATQSSAEQVLRVWQMYWVGGIITASDYRAKLLGAMDRLSGRGDDAAVIVLYAIDDPAGEGDAVLTAFTRANLGTIMAQLRATRDGDGASAGVAVNADLVNGR
jgi:exosortase A